MNKNIILTADVLDIIFDGRNKAYGAYNLRKTYQQRLMYALMGTITFCATTLLISIFLKNHQHKTGELIYTPVELSKIPTETKKAEIVPPPSAAKPAQPQVKTIASTAPRITPDVDVTTPPPDVETLNTTKIGPVTQNGVDVDGIITPPEKSTVGTGGPTLPVKKADEDTHFIGVQIEAEFPGGKSAWTRYLERNLNKELPAEAGTPTGKYTVIVSFMVDKEGNVSDVVAENNPDFGTAEEAVRVIKKGPAWKPAIQNGRAVSYRMRQLITFIVDPQG